MGEIVTFCVAVGVALGLTAAARSAGLASGIVDLPDDPLKVHDRPVSLLGGLAVVVTTLAVLLGTGHLPAAGVIAAVSLCFAVGLVDDLRTLSPAARVPVQAIAGVLLVIAGIRMDPFGSAGPIVVIVLTVIVVNAVNLIDGQDGLAGGVSFFAALSLAGVAWLGGDSSASRIGFGLAGALLGFLFWNRPRARVFLGDSGAYAVGALLAVLASRVVAIEGGRGLLASGACLGVFAFEFLFSFSRRIGSRTALTVGDRLHSYDLLSARSSRNSATLRFWALGVSAGILGLLIVSVPAEFGAAIAAIASAAMAVWGVRLWARSRSYPTAPSGSQAL